MRREIVTAGQAAARDPGARDRPRRRQPAGQGRHPPDRDQQPRPRGRGRRRPLPRGPAVPPQRARLCSCRRCASGRATSRPLARHFAAKLRPGQRPAARGRSARRRWRGCGSMPWRGNVRELENCMHRAVLLAQRRRRSGPRRSCCRARAPGAAARAGRRGRAGRPHRGRGRARLLILDTLRHTLGNRTHAATILGISIRTLRNKLREYGGEGVPVPPPTGGRAATRQRAGRMTLAAGPGCSIEPAAAAAGRWRCARATSCSRSA